ncbi:MAG: hypothetical protein RLN90_09165 [Balneolaceae bacterium]
MYNPFDATQYLCLSGMIITFVSSVSLMVQLSRAAGNPKFDLKRYRNVLEEAFSKEKAKLYKRSYFGSWIGLIVFLFGLIAWFVERAIRLG